VHEASPKDNHEIPYKNDFRSLVMIYKTDKVPLVILDSLNTFSVDLDRGFI